MKLPIDSRVGSIINYGKKYYGPREEDQAFHALRENFSSFLADKLLSMTQARDIGKDSIELRCECYVFTERELNDLIAEARREGMHMRPEA